MSQVIGKTIDDDILACAPKTTKGITRWLTIFASIAFYYIFVNLIQFEGVSPEGKKSIALAVIVVLFLLFDVLPAPVTVVLAALMMPQLGIMTAAESFAHFAIGAMFFVFGVFILAVGFTRTGIGYRISSFMSSHSGTGTKQVVLVYMLVVALISSILADIPTAVIFGTLANELLILNRCERGCSNFGKSLMIGIPLAATIGGLGTPAGGALNIMTISILENLTGIRITFLQWTLAMMPFVVIMIVLSWLLLMKIFPSEVEKIKPMEKVSEPLSSKEKKYLVLFGLILILWLTESIHGFPLWSVAVIGVSFMFLPGIDIISWKDVQDSKEMNYEVPILIGGTNVVAVALSITGGAAWIAMNTFGMVQSTAILLILVTLVVVYGHYLIPSSTASIAVFVPVVVALAESTGISPTILAFLVCISAHLTILLPQSDPVSLATFSHRWWDMRDMIKTGWAVSFAWVPISVITVIVLGLFF